MAYYNVKERVEMVSNCIRGMSFQEVADHFAVSYPQRRVPCKTTVKKLFDKFSSTGCIVDSHCKRKRNAPVLTENCKLNVCLAVEENPYVNLTQLAGIAGLSRSSAYRALKQEKWKSYKVRNVQELLPHDYFNRMEFCQYWIDKINNNPDVANLILFSDESSFCTNGTVNRQNTRIWGRENPYVIQGTHTQYRKTVNVWAGILGNKIIGPFFIDGALTAEKYLELLLTKVGPALAGYRNNEEIIFQHDGAPAHSAAEITEFLNNTFPGSWIGRFGPYKWPARSPDLTPLDFFYWGYVSSKVFDNIRERPTDVQELKRRIIEASRRIKIRQLQNVRRHFHERLGHCLAVNGGHFEQFI